MSRVTRSSLWNANDSTRKRSCNYDDITQTPIGGGNRKSEIPIYPSTPSKRKSLRRTSSVVLEDKDEMTDELGESDKDDCHTGSPPPSSEESNSSNQENEEIQKMNESTPSSRSRRSSRRINKNGQFTCEPKPNSINCTIRRNSEISSPNANSSYRKRPLRESVMKRNALAYFPDDDSDVDSNNETPPRSRVRNNSYFTKADNEDYCPNESDSSGDENAGSSIEEEDETDGSESDNDNDSVYEECKSTPLRKPLNMSSLAKMVLTPEILHQVEGRAIKRRLDVDSPVATGSQTMSPNPETYFLAENRIKYKKERKVKESVMNDAMKGKGTRKKRLRTLLKTDKLPERAPSNFSVTAEAMKARANIDWEKFIPGSTHETEVERLFQNITENEFPNWLGLFRDNFNVMLYGYGSKLGIFREFEHVVKDYLVVTVNGLFPKLNPRKILNGLYEYVNPEEKMPHGTNIEAVTREIVAILEKENHEDIFILINNFDNMALRAPNMLTVICLIARIPYINILASCDSVNAFLGVTQSQALELRFCWMHCPTFQQYGEELKWVPGVYGDESKTVTQKCSLKYVLQSLTGNARKAFALLGQMQLKQMKSHSVKKSKDEFTGVRFQELAKECREKFIAHSDENLRTLLVEFFDHKLIRQTGKGRHIENTLLIELEAETLEEVISEL